MEGLGIKHMLNGIFGPKKQIETDDDDHEMEKLPVMSAVSSAGGSKMSNKLLNNSKEQEQLSGIVHEGVMYFALPAVAVTVAMTFAMRRRMFKLTTPEKVYLGGLHYFGAATLGAFVGMSLYAPTFNKKVLEQMPHSDLARTIRMEQSSRS